MLEAERRNVRNVDGVDEAHILPILRRKDLRFFVFAEDSDVAVVVADRHFDDFRSGRGVLHLEVFHSGWS